MNVSTILVLLQIATINGENLISALLVRIMVSCKGPLTTFHSSLSLSLNNYMVMGKHLAFMTTYEKTKVPSITLGILYRHSIFVKVKGLTDIKQLIVFIDYTLSIYLTLLFDM